MKYNNITRAVFLARPNRFLAEVEIDGRRETVHVKNTGRCRELLVPGCEVYLTAPGTPGRKTKYDLVAVRKGNGVLFNIDSQAPNQVVKEWLKEQLESRLEEQLGARLEARLEAQLEPQLEEQLEAPFKEYRVSLIRPEYPYGDSRIDFYVERERSEASSGCDQSTLSPERILMEVKGCTLEVDGIGYFPDAPTERGVKHIRELIRAKEEGYTAVLAFVIQMDGVTEVRPNEATHPAFAEAMKEAEAAGVAIRFFTCRVEPDEMVITGGRI